MFFLFFIFLFDYAYVKLGMYDWKGYDLINGSNKIAPSLNSATIEVWSGSSEVGHVVENAVDIAKLVTQMIKRKKRWEHSDSDIVGGGEMGADIVMVISDEMEIWSMTY